MGSLLALAGCSSSKNKDEPKEAPTVGADAAAPAVKLPKHRVFADPAAALAEVLKTEPRVLGVGEYHELQGGPQVRSTLHRFAGLIDQFRGRASDFILETWVKKGKCGKTEKRVERDVAVSTQRPAHTESEMLRLLKRAKSIGIQPHVLEMKCGDYESLLDDNKKVDYEKVLALVTRKLRDLTRLAVTERNKQVAAGKRKKGIIIVYGGALHNDLYPYDSVKEFSYALLVKDLPAADYVELDLYVPEYVAGNKLLMKEDWYPLLDQVAATDKVVLVERKPRSYILIMRKQLAR